MTRERVKKAIKRKRQKENQNKGNQVFGESD
jgi:hypothetical protein